MNDLPPDLYRPAFLVLLAIFSLLLGVLGYLLRDMRTDLKEKQSTQDTKIEALDRRLTSVVESLPKEYVLREDFIRAVGAIELKIDAMARDVGEIAKAISRLSAGGGGGAE